MLILYKIITFLIYYITLPYTFVMYLTGSRKWSDRLGYHRVSDRSDKTDIWLHASSMGEVKVLGILIDHLKRQRKDLTVYITIMTETGFARAHDFTDNDKIVGYCPLDYNSSIRRFLNKIRPEAAVFIETEIWPNIILELEQRDVPLFLANGRMSGKAFRRYRLFKSALARVFECYKVFLLQTENDKDRYLELGAHEDNVNVLGSLKFDAPVRLIPNEKKKHIMQSLPFDRNARIFIAGSTRNGEHEIVLDAYKSLSEIHADLKLILVPRHLQKIPAICRMLDERAISFRLYTQLEDNAKGAGVLLVDKIGVLNDLYAISDIAFVGGTLADIGGHNILEPVWAGVPVLFGPSIFNVKDGAEYILQNHYGEMVQDENELVKKLGSFLAGKLVFHKKSSNSDEPSRASRTAEIILEKTDL